MSKQKIIESAIFIFNADFSASLDKVATHAYVSRRTLHRHFKDRQDLLDACIFEMMKTWQAAMLVAFKNSTDPIKQLEEMLYAGIDCGVKYAFLTKLQNRAEELSALPTGDSEAYTKARDRWFSFIPDLGAKKIINNNLSIAWIRILFTHMIMAAVDALQSGDVAPNTIKENAWYSFRRSIGMD